MDWHGCGRPLTVDGDPPPKGSCSFMDLRAGIREMDGKSYKSTEYGFKVVKSALTVSFPPVRIELKTLTRRPKIKRSGKKGAWARDANMSKSIAGQRGLDSACTSLHRLQCTGQAPILVSGGRLSQ